MKLILKKNSLYNLLCNISIGILLFLFFYKLHFQSFIPISGDELNSILVYSSNIKTVFLKNFPGNVTFFHFFGYLKTLFFSYDLISYRSITFIFFVLHFWILKKLKFNNNFTLLFLSLVFLSSSFTYYAGQYTGYIFSSFIFILIFYLIKENENEKHTKLILFLLFIQIYNHLVNLYLVVPIIVSMFIYSKKKLFIKKFLFYYLLPTLTFYFISIILTGLAILKVPNTNLDFIFLFLIENYQNVLLKGFNQIFFYEAYIQANNFNLIETFKDFFTYDSSILILFLISIIISAINFKGDNKIFSVIIFIHVLTFFLIYKNPHPRIFTGFYCFYIFVIFNFFQEKKIFLNFIENKKYFWILLIIPIFQLINFNYLKNLTPVQYKDINFVENNKSTNYLKRECKLINQNFSEIQKRNYYFNYLNICNQDFNLTEFLKYYRS